MKTYFMLLIVLILISFVKPSDFSDDYNHRKRSSFYPDNYYFPYHTLRNREYQDSVNYDRSYPPIPKRTTEKEEDYGVKSYSSDYYGIHDNNDGFKDPYPPIPKRPTEENEDYRVKSYSSDYYGSDDNNDGVKVYPTIPKITKEEYSVKSHSSEDYSSNYSNDEVKKQGKPIYNIEDAPELFKKFIKDYNKQYKDDEDYKKHYDNFVNSLKEINTTNSSNATYTADINMLSDAGSELWAILSGIEK
ncbi:unnamed protein product [Chilo suppressalis]|uniref:Cathepsin propeptide inhibitor domain-containing protein n=1 Tax=Chilo suppressalis TaxID=168631 RepID=A0ABN8AQM0_CHISP|nr:unnamed protein product [Chilo suppressalis]